MENINENYKKLENNLVDLIIEEQAKLGYQKEMIRFYYPLSSLNHFFNCDGDADHMQTLLADFPAYMQKNYGEVHVGHKADRFCFRLSAQASEYVYNTKNPNEFIIKLIQLLSHHDTTIQQVKDLFNHQPCDCVIEPVDNGEFDILIRFVDSTDRYYYCFKDEGCHIIYHRFLPEDYEDFDF